MLKYLYTELPDARERRQKAMKDGLRHISEYCGRRANGDHCPDTTMTNLKKKVIALEVRVRAVGVTRSIAPPEEWTSHQTNE